MDSRVIYMFLWNLTHYHLDHYVSPLVVHVLGLLKQESALIRTLIYLNDVLDYIIKDIQYTGYHAI